MEKQEIWQAIEREMAVSKYTLPVLPIHICSKATMVNIEAGELSRACENYKYRKDKTSIGKEVQLNAIKTEAVQVIVAAFRLLENLKD